MQNRPTWDLSGESFPATFPTSGIDPEAALAQVLNRSVSYARGRDMNDVAKQIGAYFLEGAQDALVLLAISARNGDLDVPQGWRLKEMANSVSSVDQRRVEFCLECADGPGGWLFSIECETGLTQEVKDRGQALRKEVTRELDAAGVPQKGRELRFLFAKDRTPAEKALEALEKDPASYRGFGMLDKLRSLRVVALNIKGPPEGVSIEKCSNPEGLIESLRANAYSRGLQFEANLFPLTNRENDMICAPTSINIGGSAEIGLHFLSDLLVANGLTELVARKEAMEVASKSWISYGDVSNAELMEAANSAVHASRGLIDDSVIDRMARLSAGLAAHDMNLHLPDILTLIEGLAENGHDSADHEYDAQHGDQYGWVERGDRVDTVHSKTQNGRFTTVLERDDAGQPLGVTCTERKLGVIGRFSMRDGNMVEDYRVGTKDSEWVPYQIEAVRAMNDLISNLASLSCCVEEEYDESGPGF